MREIKFRAWIPEASNRKPQMFYQNTQYLGSFLRRANFFASEMEHDKYGVSAEPPKLTLLQFTGLKDKNGKEIYEGDIISMPHSKADGYVVDENGNWKSVVVWGEKEARWQSDNGIGFSFAYGVEVIGNIYENPELLHETKMNDDAPEAPIDPPNI